MTDARYGIAGESMTYEEFDRMDEPEEYRLELDRGMLVREPRPGASHSRVVMRLSFELERFAREHGGWIVYPDCRFLLGLDPAIVRIPDVAVIARSRLGYVEPPGTIEMPPDLAIEVISPTNRPADMANKVAQYLDCGVGEVWVVHPEDRRVVVHWPAGKPREFRQGDVLPSVVIPDLRLPVAAIFHS